MQKAFWRALEARGSCDCAICTPIRPGLTRQINTLPAKRRIKFGDVVTIVYGTVLGTAAFYDGTSKKRRRENIDNALAGLLLENEAVVRDQEARLKALGYNGTESYSVLSEDLSHRTSNASWISWNTILKRSSLSKPPALHVRHYSTKSTNNEDKDGSNRNKSWYKPILARQKKRVLERLHMSLMSWEEARFVSKDERRPNWDSTVHPEARVVGKSIEEAWEDMPLVASPQQRQIRRAAVAQLVLGLIKTYLTSINTGRDGASTIQLTDADGTISRFSLQDITNITQSHERLSQRIESIKEGIEMPTELEMIGSFEFPHFRYHKREDGIWSPYHLEIRHQNDDLVAIFLQADNPADLISKLCNFLSSRRCAPNIHTMNLLLLLFLDIQWYRACRVVIATISVMAANQNEVTDVAKLQYAYLTQTGLSLDGQRARMLCVDGRRTRAAFKLGNLTTETFQREQVSEQTRLQDGTQTIIPLVKAGWTAEAFSIVIIDLLDRGELAEALAEIASMHLSGLQETPEILEALLQYSVFHEDWKAAKESWNRFNELCYEKSVLTWYWMLQACATCQQPHIFHKVAIAGIQQGVLKSNIQYSVEAFQLSVSARERLRRKVHALGRLQYKIPIPRLLHRDLHIQSSDIIQMPNLDQTMLTVYLQYVKLRSSTFGWFIDHLNYLRDTEREFRDLVESLHTTPEVLRDFRERWAAYDEKLEPFAIAQKDRHITESAELNPADSVCCDLEAGILTDATRMKELPAVPTFRDIRTRFGAILSIAHHEKVLPGLSPNKLKSNSSSWKWPSLTRLRNDTYQKSTLDRQTSLEDGSVFQIRGQSELRSVDNRYSQSFGNSSTEHHMQTVRRQTHKNRWIWAQQSQYVQRVAQSIYSAEDSLKRRHGVVISEKLTKGQRFRILRVLANGSGTKTRTSMVVPEKLTKEQLYSIRRIPTTQDSSKSRTGVAVQEKRTEEQIRTSVGTREKFAEKLPTEPGCKRGVTVELQDDLTQPREDMLAIEQISRSTQKAHRIEHDIDTDKAYTREYQVAAMA